MKTKRKKPKKKGTVRGFARIEWNEQKKRMVAMNNRESMVHKFRAEWQQKGFELIDITKLCEVRMDCHGCCNEINEPDENIYHIKIMYRGDYHGEIIAQFDGKYFDVIDDAKYIIYIDSCGIEDCHCRDAGFIVFRKVKVKHGKS